MRVLVQLKDGVMVFSSQGSVWCMLFIIEHLFKGFTYLQGNKLAGE